MNQCPACKSDIFNCPVCRSRLGQDIHGTWYHLESEADQRNKGEGCPWNGFHLGEEQLEYLAETKPDYRRTQWTACQCCVHFCGHQADDRHANPCRADPSPAMRLIFYEFARMNRCPLYERAKGMRG